MTTSTKSGLSKDFALRSKVTSSNFQVGDQSCHNSLPNSPRFACKPARLSTGVIGHDGGMCGGHARREQNGVAAGIVGESVHKQDRKASVRPAVLVGDVERGCLGALEHGAPPCWENTLSGAVAAADMSPSTR